MMYDYNRLILHALAVHKRLREAREQVHEVSTTPTRGVAAELAATNREQAQLAWVDAWTEYEFAYQRVGQAIHWAAEQDPANYYKLRRIYHRLPSPYTQRLGEGSDRDSDRDSDQGVGNE